MAKVFKAFEESIDEVIDNEIIISNALHLSPMIDFKPFNQYAANFFHKSGEDILSQALEKMSNKDFRSGLPLLHDIHRPLEEAEKFTARIGRNSREASKEVSLLRKEYQSFLAIGESLQSYDWGQKIVEKLEASDDSFDSDSDDDDNDWFRGERDSCGGVPKFKRDDDKEKKNKKEKKGSKDDEKEEQSDDNSENENDDDSKDDNYEPDFNYYYSGQVTYGSFIGPQEFGCKLQSLDQDRNKISKQKFQGGNKRYFTIFKWPCMKAAILKTINGLPRCLN